jgi:hypothetical protein
MSNIPLVALSFAMCGMTGAAQAAPVITVGLIAAYDFSGNSNDSSGNGRHGTVSGAALTSDRFGNANSAYAFDGTDVITLSNTSGLNFVSAFSVSLWAQYSASDLGENWGIFGKHYVGENSGFLMTIFEAKPSFYFPTYTSLVSPTPYNDDRWHNFTGVYDGSNVSLYVDGILSASIAQGNPLANSASITIGGAEGCQPALRHCPFFHGNIDDMALYDRALSSGEVRALFADVAEPATTFIMCFGLAGLLVIRNRARGCS